MKTELTIKKGNIQLEKYLEGELANLRGEAQSAGISHGNRNLPLANETDLVPIYLGAQVNSLQLIINKIKEQIGFEHFLSIYQLKRKEFSENIKRWTIEKNRLENTILEITQDLSQFRNFSSRTVMLTLLPLLLVLFIESAGMYSAFSAVIASTFTKLLIAIASGIVLSILAHLIVHVFTSGTRLLRIVVILIVASLLYLIGVLRSYAMAIAAQNIMDDTQVRIFSSEVLGSAILFSMLTAGLLAVGVYIAYITKDKLKLMFTYMTLKRNLKKLQFAHQKKLNEIAQAQKDVDESKISAYTAYNDASHGERQVISWLGVIQSIYSHHNVMHRTDEQRPPCLTKPIQFAFRTHYQNPGEFFTGSEVSHD